MQNSRNSIVHKKTYCNILDVQTTTTGIDPFGSVSDGWLTLSGKVIQVTMNWAEEGKLPRHHPLRVLSGSEEIGMGDLDILKHKPANENLSKAATVQQPWAVLLAKCTRNKSWPRGLLLVRTGRKKNGVDEFQRIGVFMVYLERSTHALTCWENCELQTITIT